MICDCLIYRRHNDRHRNLGKHLGFGDPVDIKYMLWSCGFLYCPIQPDQRILRERWGKQQEGGNGDQTITMPWFLRPPVGRVYQIAPL